MPIVVTINERHNFNVGDIVAMTFKDSTSPQGYSTNFYTVVRAKEGCVFEVALSTRYELIRHWLCKKALRMWDKIKEIYALTTDCD